MGDKKEKLYEAILVFQNSNQGTDDYLKLFQTITQVTKQGSGLMWSDIKKILDKSIKGV